MEYISKPSKTYIDYNRTFLREVATNLQLSENQEQIVNEAEFIKFWKKNL